MAFLAFLLAGFNPSFSTPDLRAYGRFRIVLTPRTPKPSSETPNPKAPNPETLPSPKNRPKSAEALKL